MLHTTKTLTILATRWASVICGLLVSATLGLLPASAQAQCTNWDASGELNIIQREVDTIVLSLEQKGIVITGKAYYDAKDGSSNGFGTKKISGTVDGTIEGDKFSVQIFWPDNLTGVYNAKVLPSGRLDGETHDKKNSKISQLWHSVGVLKCAPPPAQSNVNSQPPKPKSSGKMPPKPKSSGKMPPKPKEEPSPPPMKVPGIVASQVIYLFPGALTGSVILTWDAGPDHPYAEVWVKVNNGDDTFVVELGKGSRSVQVQRGWSYSYILTDAGETLATVSFVVP